MKTTHLVEMVEELTEMAHRMAPGRGNWMLRQTIVALANAGAMADEMEEA